MEESTIRIQTGRQLVNVKAIANVYVTFILVKPFSEPSCPVDGSGVILEETTAMGRNVSTQDKGEQSEDLL